MRIDHADAVPLLNILDDQRFEERRLSGAGLTDHVEMAQTVFIGDVHLRLLVAERIDSHECPLLRQIKRCRRASRFRLFELRRRLDALGREVDDRGQFFGRKRDTALGAEGSERKLFEEPPQRAPLHALEAQSVAVGIFELIERSLKLSQRRKRGALAPRRNSETDIREHDRASRLLLDILDALFVFRSRTRRLAVPLLRFLSEKIAELVIDAARKAEMDVGRAGE